MQSNGRAFKDEELTVCFRISSLVTRVPAVASREWSEMGGATWPVQPRGSGEAQRAAAEIQGWSLVTKSHLINPHVL
jgi:hypothetical protein